MKNFFSATFMVLAVVWFIMSLIHKEPKSNSDATNSLVCLVLSTLHENKKNEE